MNQRQGSPLDLQGNINRNGENWVQVGGIPDDERVQNREASAFDYDPQFGLITRASNIKVPENWLDSNMPAIMMLAAGGIGASYAGALGASGAGAEAAGTGAFDMGGSAGVFDSFGNPLYTSPGAGGLAEAGAFDMGGSNGFGGTQPIAGGQHGLLNNVTSPTLNAVGPSASAGNGGLLGSLMNGDFAGAGSALMNDPVRLLGLLQAGRGLIGGGSSGGSSGGGGGDKGGGSGSGMPQMGQDLRGPWVPNAITAAQIQNFSPAIPRGWGG